MLLKTRMSTTPTNQKRWFQFLSLSLLLGLAAAIGALIFFGWLTDEVLEGDSRHFDEVTRAAVHQLASPVLTAIMRFLSFIGSTIVLTIGTIIVVALFTVRKWSREAKLFAATMIGAGVLNVTLKLTFKRARPTPFFDLTPPETYSFPSGHSLASACFFGALAAIVTARIKNRRTRVAVWIICAAMFLLIGLSRIYLGVHHTTDVIAGFAAALIWILVVRFVEMELARRRRKKSDRIT
jgi:undecaprenyl-diphosphatase